MLTLISKVKLFSDEIFKAIRDSENHNKVTQEHPIPLQGSQQT